MLLVRFIIRAIGPATSPRLGLCKGSGGANVVEDMPKVSFETFSFA
jgi:hypothetical protein